MEANTPVDSTAGRRPPVASTRPSLRELAGEVGCAVQGIEISDFNLERTLHSGQVFHWLPFSSGYVGAIGEVPVFLRQERSRLFVSRGTTKLVQSYLALDHPMPKILASFPQDATMQAAVRFCPGLRIIRQPVWECLATFITSSLKQVRQISAISLAIREKFGQKIRIGQKEIYTYPSASVLAGATLPSLLDCKLGFRAKNLLSAARIVAEGGVDLEKLGNDSTENIREALCRLPGVGGKIANCVLLFAYERLDVVPIDVWVRRILETRYFSGNVPPARLKAFSEEYFGPFAGYAQQYLFHHWRLNYPRER